jgi:hypothetical protein
MNALRAWFIREARRVARRVRLEDALLGGGFAAYALYRLRYFAARTAAAAVLHAAKIILAFRIFLPGDFTAILVAEAAAALAGGFWWGSLEMMRERIRDLRDAGRQRAMAAEIGRWLSWTMRFAAALAAAGMIGAGVRASIKGSAFSPADLFLASIPLRLGLELVARCYHSGIYAVRRVYRPLAAILFVEMAGFGAVLGLWPILGSWALPAASLVSSLLAAVLLFRFTARAYRHYGANPWPHVHWKGAARPRGAGGSEWLGAGAANALMRIDAVALLAVAAAARSGASPPAVLLLAVGPLVRASADWARLFYFDLKRQDTVLLQGIKDAFERKLIRLSLPVALALGAAAAGTAAILFGERALPVLPSLVLFLAARSVLAGRQMGAFAARSYGLLILTGTGVAAGWALAAILFGDPPTVLLAGAIVLLAAVLVTTGHGGRLGNARRWGGKVLALPDWIREVQFVGSPGTILSVQFSPGSIHRGRDDPEHWAEDDRWAHRQIAETAARRLGRNGLAAFSGPAGLLLFEKKDRGSRLSRETLLTLGAGLIRSVQTTGVCLNGAAAAAMAAEAGFWGSAYREAPDEAGLEGEFKRRFPRGLVFAPGRAVPSRLAALSPDDRGAIFADALAFAADFHGRRPLAKYEASVYVDGSVIRKMFVLGPSTPASLRVRWRETVRRSNFRAALSAQPIFPGSRRNKPHSPREI